MAGCQSVSRMACPHACFAGDQRGAARVKQRQVAPRVAGCVDGFDLPVRAEAELLTAHEGDVDRGAVAVTADAVFAVVAVADAVVGFELRVAAGNQGLGVLDPGFDQIYGTTVWPGERRRAWLRCRLGGRSRNG